MKTNQILLPLMTVALCLASCQKPDPSPDPLPQGNVERTIVYAVGNTENHCTLETEAAWDALLDQLCNQAEMGSEVAFYNTNYIPSVQHKKGNTPKEGTTISTTSRDEIKAWMKDMEKQGLTVRVTYDEGSGTWNGTAYATAPAESTTGTLIGTWRFNCMVVSQFDLNGELISSDLFAPDDNGGTWYYTFSDDGNVTLTINGIDGTTATDSSTWNLSDDGVLFSDLMPSGTYWNVNWITNNTMIISSANLGTMEGDNMYYQLQFDRQ